MTDGTTGFHVAPITEDDMNRVTSILKRAMDTMIGASQLAADVDMLRSTVAGLQADTDRLRNQNNALDEALNYSRSERDRQAAKLSETETQLDIMTKQRDTAMADFDKLDLAQGQLHIDLELTRKERDDAQFKALDLEDKLAAAEAKLAKIAEVHKAIFPETEPVFTSHKPEPVVVHVEPEHSIVDILPCGQADPIPAPSAPAGPDSQDHWDPGYAWDNATMKYWRQGVIPKADGEAIPF